MMQIRYNMTAANTTILGPGNRAVLWTQGCSRVPPCEGCIGESARDPLGGKLESTERVCRWILSCPRIDGITISGGEPFDQAAAVAELVRMVRATRPELSLVVYTGRYYEQLLEQAASDPATAELLSQIQVLIDGPYVAALDDGVPYRGSSNQRILILDEAYRPQAQAYYTSQPGRKIELIVTPEGTRMVGVPSRTQAQSWLNLKRRISEREEK